MKSIDLTTLDELKKHFLDKLLPAITYDYVHQMPTMLKPLQDAGVNLNAISTHAGGNILQQAILRNHCFAYFLDLGLDPFAEDYSDLGWSTVHLAIIHSYNQSLRRLMGMAFTDHRFRGFLNKRKASVEFFLSRESAELQAAFRETQIIFYTYRGFHDSAETAEEYHDHLIAALHYFLAAEQMKTEVADKEDDPYLKRFHLKKVVNDLRKATGHYYQEIIEREETLPALDEFDRYLALSAEIIDSVEPDHPDIDWEIKLGDEAFFADWRVQLEVLQKWREERRISFSSESSEDGIATRDIKEDEPLLGAGADLRYRFPHR